MRGRERRVPDRVRDILEAIGNANADIGPMNKELFLADGKTQRAVIESIVVIGEAANQIMQAQPALEVSHPALWQQFRDAYGMRIVLTHEYFRVDVSVVWNTVKNDLPGMQVQLQKFLDE